MSFFNWITAGAASLVLAGAFSVSAAEESAFAKAQKEIKAKYPAEVAEIEKLALTDMEAAQRKLQELSRKSGIRLPRDRGSFRGSERGDRGNRGGERGGERGDRGNRGGERGGQFGGERGGRWGGPEGGRGGQFGGMRMMRMNLLERFTAEASLRKLYPKETEELDLALRETEKKFQALAVKAKTQLPQSMETKLRNLRAAKPAEFAKLEEQENPDPRETMTQLRKMSEEAGIELFPAPRTQGGEGFSREGEKTPDKPGLREIRRPNLKQLRQNYPEEMKRYDELRSENPKEARKLLEALIARSRAEKK